jgi:hypothetical protein
MTPRNRIKNLNATDDSTSQQTRIIPVVTRIENHAVQDRYAQYRIRSMKKPRIHEATFEAFVLNPLSISFVSLGRGFAGSLHS